MKEKKRKDESREDKNSLKPEAREVRIRKNGSEEAVVG